MAVESAKSVSETRHTLATGHGEHGFETCLRLSEHGLSLTNYLHSTYHATGANGLISAGKSLRGNQFHSNLIRNGIDWPMARRTPEEDTSCHVTSRKQPATCRVLRAISKKSWPASQSREEIRQRCRVIWWTTGNVAMWRHKTHPLCWLQPRARFLTMMGFI